MKKNSTLLFIFSFFILNFSVLADKCGINTDSYMKTKYEACLKETTKVWSDDLCRCKTKVDAISEREANANCGALENEEQKKQCYEAVATKEGLKDTSMQSKINPGLLQVYEIVNIITGALGGGAESKCFSMQISKYTGLASTVGTLYAYFKVDDEAAKAREDYEKATLASNNYQAQMEVFEFLRNEQQAIKEIASYKEKLHMATALGYTASTGYAIAEMASLVNTAGCQTKLTGAVPVVTKQEKMKMEEKVKEKPSDDHDKLTRDEERLEPKTQSVEDNSDKIAELESERKELLRQKSQTQTELDSMKGVCNDGHSANCPGFGQKWSKEDAKAWSADEMHKSNIDGEGNTRTYFSEKGKSYVHKTSPDGDWTLQEVEIVKDERGVDSFNPIGEESSANYGSGNGAYGIAKKAENSRIINIHDNKVKFETRANDISSQLETNAYELYLARQVRPVAFEPEVLKIADVSNNVAQEALKVENIVEAAYVPKVDILSKDFLKAGAIQAAQSTVKVEELKYYDKVSEDSTKVSNNKGQFDYVGKVNEAYQLEREALSPSLTKEERREKLLQAKLIWKSVIDNTTDESLKSKYETKVEYIEEQVQMIDSVAHLQFDFFLKGTANFVASVLFTNTYAVDSTGDKVKKLGLGMVKSSLISMGVAFIIQKVAPPFMDKIQQMLQTSPSIAIFSGINAYINYDLMSGAKAQKKAAEANIASLEAIKARFSQDQEQFCPAGRDDINNLDCYCYNEDGSPNQTGRSNSAKCTALWAVNSNNLYVKPGIAQVFDPAKREGCVTENNKFDVDCNCRNEKNDQGKNTCMDVNLRPISASLGMNSFMPLGNVSDAITSVGEGSFGNNLDSSGLESNLATAMKNKDTLVRKLEKSKGQKFPAKDLNNNKVMKLLNKAGLSQGKLASLSSSNLLKGGLAGFDKKTKNAISNPEETMKNPRSALDGDIMKSSVKMKRGSSKKNNGWNFESSSKSSKSKDMKFMDKKYKHNNADIVKDDSVSIFDILSNRYRSSGYRKLFEK